MRTWSLVLLMPLANACGGGGPESPLRSPTRDYPPPPARDAQGQVIGVDGVPPEDRTRETPAMGSDGPRAAEGPGGEESHKSHRGHKPSPPDPCDQIGLRDKDGRSHCADHKENEGK